MFVNLFVLSGMIIIIIVLTLVVATLIVRKRLDSDPESIIGCTEIIRHQSKTISNQIHIIGELDYINNCLADKALQLYELRKASIAEWFKQGNATMAKLVDEFNNETNTK